jgi:rhamnosyltransferase
VSQDLVAVVPTFRPDATVTQLIGQLAARSPVVVSDDASPCTSDGILRDLAASANVTVVRHSVNAGIARGLNDGLRAAQQMQADWLLTVDQDTVVDANYVDALVAIAKESVTTGLPIGAIGAGQVHDTSGTLTYPTSAQGAVGVTEEIIQTGSLWSVSAMTSIGGFDESLGIDAVDAAACLRLRELGLVVCVAPTLEIHHSVGVSRTMNILGRSVMVTGHSPERRTTMLRNRLRLFPAEFRTVRRVIVNQGLGLLTESDRKAKAKGTLLGAWRVPGTSRRGMRVRTVRRVIVNQGLGLLTESDRTAKAKETRCILVNGGSD